MTDLALATTPQDSAPTGPTVWILSEGEQHEGGTILGVYLDKDLARGAFLAKAQELQDRFSIDDARQGEDGSLHLYGGCDWIALEPHPVVTALELDA